MASAGDDLPEEPSGEPGDNPFAQLFGAGGEVPDLSTAMHRLGDLLSGQSGPVNWNLARQTALQSITDPGTIAAETAEVAEAVRLADVWLDPTTTLPSGVTATEAWSRRRWVEATLPAFSELCDPVAARVVEAMGGTLDGEMAQLAGPLLGVFRQIGGVMFGAQVGQALGALAGEVVASTDVGLPLGPSGLAALLPANVAEFGTGLGVPADEVRIFLALREAAHHRLFRHVPWLKAHLYDAVAAYARGISVDTGGIEEAMRDIDPQRPESLQQALSGGLFRPQTTPDQQAALTRLETALALVEGWVDAVTSAAASGQLPALDSLRETVRRRRASGGPAEQTFANLVGLQLRPRRLREAARLWITVASARGTAGRDAIWAHPDLLPSAEDLDDPEGFAARIGSTEIDLSDLASAEDPDTPPSDADGGPPESGPETKPDEGA
jgi:putative hydrolase